jgi:hypothetical protein
MRKFTALLVIALIVVAGLFFFFFYQMGSNDAKALADFPVAYKNYDQAISDFSKAVMTSNPESAPEVSEFKRKADEALVGLKTKASVRISSLTKNDGDLMRVSTEIADLAGKELDALQVYQSAVANKSSDSDQLAKEFRDLTIQRQMDYTRYLELAG